MLTQENIKVVLMVCLIAWVFVFSIDMMFGISWPNYTLHRVFIWSPTVLIGVYWLIFGGKNTK